MRDVAVSRTSWRAGLRLLEITGSEFVPRTFLLRYEIWKKEAVLHCDVVARGAVAYEHDSHARHWAVLDDDRIVAAARMYVHNYQADTPDFPAFSEVHLPAPIATIKRLLVHDSLRGCGLAVGHVPEQNRPGERREMCGRDSGRSQNRISGAGAGFRQTGGKWVQPYAESLVFHAMVLALD
jgi:hypothetical protein